MPDLFTVRRRIIEFPSQDFLWCSFIFCFYSCLKTLFFFTLVRWFKKLKLHEWLFVDCLYCKCYKIIRKAKERWMPKFHAKYCIHKQINCSRLAKVDSRRKSTCKRPLAFPGNVCIAYIQGATTGDRRAYFRKRADSDTLKRSLHF